MMQQAQDSWAGRCARWVVRRVAQLFYPHIEVTGRDRIPQDGPVLLCANHANSLLDPVLIGIAARRPVRFMAKAPLFDTPFLGPIMKALGMVPAFRGSDDARQVRKNMESLDTAALVLVQGVAMGIFPEGRSHDNAQVELVRSGAARIAIKALEAGAQGLRVVPVAINYEQKDRFRSSVWIQIGEPIVMDDWLESHGGDARQAMRALTPEIQQRLQDVVVHLDDVQWEPFLHDLEVLVPARPNEQGRSASPVRQRKFIADAMNHFLKTDRPRAVAIGSEIRDYRQALHQSGLQVDSPMLRSEGWRMVLLMLVQRFWVAAMLIPAIIGTLIHVVPFTIVRLLAERMQAPGKTTVSLSRLSVGLPVYGLWYVLLACWLYATFTSWFATCCLVAMPFLGVLALQYWREVWDAIVLRWHQARFFVGGERLQKLRQQQAGLRTRLTALAQEYEDTLPGIQTPPATRRWPRYRLAPVWATLAVLVGGLIWLVWSPTRDRPLVDHTSGLQLQAMSAESLNRQLESDERSLTSIIAGLDELGRRTAELHADFAAGRRSHSNEADTDAVRQLLLSYLNYRTALIRLIWKYQGYAQAQDERQQLRAFLVGFTSASVLSGASTMLVHQFADRPDTKARLNEGEPAWNIRAGLYDEIERNLANRANRELMASARKYYDTQQERFKSRGLGKHSVYAPFHQAIERSAETMRALGGAAWVSRATLAARDVTSLVDDVRYNTQTAISTWIGDVRIREPRQGESLIQPQHLEQLRDVLRPGDILLERRNWYLSNAFLPGFWPHAALYVGTSEDLKSMGLDVDPRVAAFWDEFAALDEEGHPHVIVEALSEGVVFASLEHSIGGADAAAVLRPLVSPEEIKEAIGRAFGHAAKPYDFEFDFTSRDKLVCTEVVFRAYGANEGPIEFPLQNICGRVTMPAIELVRKFRDERSAAAPQLDFVALVDGDEHTGSATYSEDAELFVNTLERPAFTFLQGVKEHPVRRIGIWGWTILGVSLFCFAFNVLRYFRPFAAPGTASMATQNVDPG